METRLVIGLMSGTSLDGVDAALIQISGGEHARTDLIHFVSIPFDEPVQAELLKIASGEPSSVRSVSHLNFLLGELYSEAVFKLCREAQIETSRVDLIGSHGQTVYHQSEPEAFCGRVVASTLQIGEASILAERTGITSVSDFRPRDMAAGGKGAPLIPYVDYLLFRDANLGRILLNIGGIANVTCLPPGPNLEKITAFDTGPGNMIIDALIRRFTKGRDRFDHEGSTARRGTPISSILQRLLTMPYFESPPPKTAGREQFGTPVLSFFECEHASLEDMVRTATEFTAQSIAQQVTRFLLPLADIDQVVVSGGGAKNRFLLDLLGNYLSPIAVLRSDDLGVPAAAKEAIGFAILANETFHFRPGNLPSATGASHPVILGQIVYGSNCRGPQSP